MKNSKLTVAEQMAVTIGLFMISLTLIAKHYYPISDNAFGFFIGIGVGLEVAVLIKVKRSRSKQTGN